VNPLVNVLIAGMMGLVLTTGLILVVELPGKEQPLHGDERWT
jgi:hypothetical protein